MIGESIINDVRNTTTRCLTLHWSESSRLTTIGRNIEWNTHVSTSNSQKPGQRRSLSSTAAYIVQLLDEFSRSQSWFVCFHLAFNRVNEAHCMQVCSPQLLCYPMYRWLEYAGGRRECTGEACLARGKANVDWKSEESWILCNNRRNIATTARGIHYAVQHSLLCFAFLTLPCRWFEKQ